MFILYLGETKVAELEDRQWGVRDDVKEAVFELDVSNNHSHTVAVVQSCNHLLEKPSGSSL